MIPVYPMRTITAASESFEVLKRMVQDACHHTVIAANSAYAIFTEDLGLLISTMTARATNNREERKGGME